MQVVGIMQQEGRTRRDGSDKEKTDKEKRKSEEAKERML